MNIDTSNLLNSILGELSSLSYVHPGDVPNIDRLKILLRWGGKRPDIYSIMDRTRSEAESKRHWI